MTETQEEQWLVVVGYELSQNDPLEYDVICKGNKEHCTGWYRSLVSSTNDNFMYWTTIDGIPRAVGLRRVAYVTLVPDQLGKEDQQLVDQLAEAAPLTDDDDFSGLTFGAPTMRIPNGELSQRT